MGQHRIREEDPMDEIKWHFSGKLNHMFYYLVTKRRKDKAVFLNQITNALEVIYLRV